MKHIFFKIISTKHKNRTYGLSFGKLQYTKASDTREAKNIRPNTIKGPVLFSVFCDDSFASKEKKKNVSTSPVLAENF